MPQKTLTIKRTRESVWERCRCIQSRTWWATEQIKLRQSETTLIVSWYDDDKVEALILPHNWR